MSRPPKRKWGDDLVPVMLPFAGSPRGPAERVRGWAMPGEFRFNYGGQSAPLEHRFPCVVMGYDEHFIWASFGDQIAARAMRADHLFPQDEVARQTLAAISAAQRLTKPGMFSGSSVEVTVVTVNGTPVSSFKL